MYCTIEGIIYTSEKLSDRIENIEKHYIHKETGELLYKAKLKNIELYESTRGIKFSGSLAKYYFSNNLETLTIKQTKESLEMLSEETQLDFNNASITRVDIATNFIMNEPILNYYDCLGSASRLDRNIKYSSLYYTNNSRSLVFYDKYKEANYRGTLIPNEYKNSYLLRYEYRHKKFYKYHLTGKDLYETDTFNWLVDTWQEAYNSIQKIQTLTFTKRGKEMINLKTLKLDCMRYYVEEKLGGVENFYKMLDSEQRKGAIEKQNKYYLKKKIEKAFQLPELIEANNLISELDNKVKEAVNKYSCKQINYSEYK